MERGKAKDRIKRQWDINKAINFNIKQIIPGDIYYKNDNWVKTTIGNPTLINGKEEIIYTTVYVKVWISVSSQRHCCIIFFTN